MKNVYVGAGLVGVSVALVVVGALWTPADPTALADRPHLPPSWRWPMGTDWFGRDVLSRVMVGGRVSWAVAAAAVATGGALGFGVGAMAGYLGGILGEVLARLGDFFLAFPASLMAVLLATVLGPGALGVALALALFTVPFFLRLSFAGVLALREQEFVVAARACGARGPRIVLRHILPNLASPLLVQLSVSLGAALLAEAGLAYLGLGVQPPHPSWGRMLREAQTYFGYSPWPAVFPGLVLGLTVLGLNLLGDGLRDLADPLTRKLSPGRP